MSKTLLNTGPSPRGWHRLQLALRCAQLYAYAYILGIKLPPSMPLIRGSLRHVGLAHHYARMRARQRGENQDAFYEPREAMERAAVEIDAEFKTDIASKIVGKHLAMPEEYAATYSEEETRWEILDVETVFEANVHGYRYTARFDLRVKDSANRVWIIDHKGAAYVDRRSVAAYSLSGQILGLQTFGASMYGDRFGGMRINFISGDKPPFEFERKAPDPAPGMLAQFPEIVRAAEERIKWIEAQPDPWNIPARAADDVVCVHRYGRCAAYDLCAWGQAGASMLGVESE